MPRALSCWQPQELVQRCALGSLAALEQALGTTSVLLVKTAPHQGTELEQSLHNSVAWAHASAPPRNAMSFETKMASPGVARPKPATERVIVGAALALVTERMFLVPVRKRLGSTTVLQDRITIGRVLTHDIVLRHESVSKFHAYFELRSSGELVLADGGSRNGTWLEGQRLDKTPTEVPPGASVRFGNIEAVHWTVEGLASVVRSS